MSTSARGATRSIEGGFADTAAARGHRLRGSGVKTDSAAQDAIGPAVQRCTVLIVGAGVAGLAAARALRARGISDYRIVELDDAIGGNSRSASVAGLPCPAGAHYLPLPGDAALEVRALLTEFGVRDAAGRYDERMLCHSPQERLHIHGVWQEGLLPMVAQPAGTLDAYRRFADCIDGLRSQRLFSMPSDRTPVSAQIRTLSGTRFIDWLAAEGLDAEGLRWYLDYCCRDDYGAGIGTVSAWAGLHYFASRHGFALPERLAGSAPRRDAAEGVLTWPQGNGWLIERMADAHRDRISTGAMVRRIEALPAGDRQRMRVETIGADPGGAPTVWEADWVIWAAPAFVAAQVLADGTPEVAALKSAARQLRHAPWLVANLLISADWQDASVEQTAWDNVPFGGDSLGYVNARHQRIDRRRGPRLWTWYRSLAQGQRADLLDRPWRHWVDLILADLYNAHPQLARHLLRVDVHRWGHAMAIPVPGLIGSEALAVLRRPIGRFRLAHSDLAGYSVFEEAVYWGHRAGADVATRIA